MSFDLAFNCVFLAIFIYHVIYFLAQYFIVKRIELFYYSVFLLSASVYYLLFFNSPLLKVSFTNSASTFLSSLQLSFSFIQIFFYVLFISAYLKLTKANSRIYNFMRFYKYYNLLFIFVFITLYFLNIESKNFYTILSFLALPLLFILLYLLRSLYSTYANIVILGTVFNIAGTVVSFALMNAEVYGFIKLSFNNHIPAQIGLLLDLFILGYGLSLKAAESDKKLMQYLLENQRLLEAERSRLARDLHDGLGGMLSGIKLNLSAIKGSAIIQQQDVTLFNKSILQLDNTIAEMRRVAHNMMPEALVKFGLTEAINDYCQSLNMSNTVKIIFTDIGIVSQLEKSTEVILYRIMQELTTNAIKYAQPKNILIQLSQHQNLITLVVEDDGNGFDVDMALQTKGSGLKNVLSRVEFLKGRFNLESAKGKGTTASIEITVS